MGQKVQNSVFKDMLAPSPEVYNSSWYDRAYQDDHATIVQRVPAGILGQPFELERLVQGHLLCLTRQYGLYKCCVLVPVADMFNHSQNPTATWAYDSNSDALIIKTSQAISCGEEIFISYGREKSNVRLHRTYGFTMAPD